MMKVLLPCLLFASAGQLSAQTPAAPAAPVPAPSTAPIHPAAPTGSPAVDASSPDSRLRQLEMIYQQQLRTRHIPMLGKYITELQQSARGAPVPAVQAEIARVQAIISAGGVVNLSAVARELNPAAAATVPAAPMPERNKRGMLMLTPSLAQIIEPTPESSASPVAATIGRLTWKLDVLPAGEYEVVLHYASVVADTAVPVTVELAGQTLTQTIEAGQATKDGKNFLLLRLGRLKLDQDVNGSPLVLSAGTVEKPALVVRNLVIGRARKVMDD